MFQIIDDQLRRAQQSRARQTNHWYLRFLGSLLGASLILAACTSTSSGEQVVETPSATTTPPASPTSEVSQTDNPNQPEPTITSTQIETSPSPTSTPLPASSPTSQPENVTSLPDPGEYLWQLVTQDLDSPIGMAVTLDGSHRLFVLEKSGLIQIIQDGEVLGPPFLDISDRVGSQGSEQGLLGLAFHPDYAGNGFFYVNYTDLNGNTVIARFQVTSDPNRADPGSEKRLLQVDQPFANHNGGNVTFGPDGYLYLGLGDGGSGGDPMGNAQSLDTLLGKILRIDVDSGDPYGIPPDNPFANGGGLPEIWAYGLRNPWRFSFDQLNQDLYIGDVGQNQWEEIDFLPAGHPGGVNFGWNYREGAHPYEGEPPANLNLIEPVAEYSHAQGCSVTGGYVYRGVDLPQWEGVFLYGDYCSGIVWGLLHQPDGSWQKATLFESGSRIASFGQDEGGEIYLLDIRGAIYRLAGR